MQTKMMTITEMDEAGKGLAVLARMDEIDHDGDTYAAGAFAWKGDQWAPLLPAHDRSKMPFGKARVFEQGSTAFAELHLNLETQAGRDWHAALKFDLANGKAVQEYSYGFDVIDADYRIEPDKRTRVLKRLDVHEVSTVVRGAGLGTGTLSMKALKEAGFAPLIAGLGELAAALKGDPATLSATGRKQIEQIHVEIGKVLSLDEDEAGASDDEGKAAFESELVKHLTRDARLKLGLA